MRKFWKKQVEDLGGDPSVLIRGRAQLAKEMVMAMVAAHKESDHRAKRRLCYRQGRICCQEPLLRVLAGRQRRL